MAATDPGTRLSPARQYLALSQRSDLLDRYRRQIFYFLAAVGAVFMVPTANHFVQGRWPQGLATLTLNVTLLVNAWCYYRKRPPVIPAWMILGPVLIALVMAIRVQGFQGVLWAYPAILLFHFLASRLVANLFNLGIVATVMPVTWAALGPELGVRVGVTLVLVILFTNIFSYIAETQQRKEADQARQLQAQNEALREAIRMREELERIARHDLKTPLASIASVPRLLREGRSLDARESELLGMVEGAALRVLSMLNLSLDLYRMEEGRYRLRAQAVDLAEEARTVTRELQAHADSKRVALVLDLPQRLPPAQAEELLCYSILANLVRNAIEASPEGGEVRIRLRQAAGGALVLAIHNPGAVPPPIRERFFEKYATHGKTGGTGLGAYSARLMARVQHGDLHMETSEEEGTTLTLRLPARPDAPDSGPETLPQPLDASPGGMALLPELSVLLVDDDEYNVMVLRNQLPSPPLDVRSAVNGRAALDAIALRRPDVVFMDLEMPVMGGFEALARLRALQAQRGDPPSRVVAFSAHDDADTRARCRDAGFDAYLTKPASREELVAVLRGVVPVARPHAVDAKGADASQVAVMDAPPADTALLALWPGFLASRREMVAQMRMRLDAGEVAAARDLAHKLAGGLAMYGLKGASAEARAIEQDLMDPSPDAARAMQGVDALQARLARLAPGSAGGRV